MRTSVFRKVALDRLSSPEQLDELMQVTRPRGWLALIALGGILVCAVLWGAFGRIATKVVGKGILTRRGGVRRVVSAHSGRVTDIRTQVGDLIERGHIVATLLRRGPDIVSQTRYLSSPHAGRVLEVMLNEGNVVEQGTPVLTLEPLRAPLEAIVYVSPADGKRARRGMGVQIAPATVKPEEFGYMLGKVRSVSAFPRTRQGMYRILGAKELVQQFSASGPPYEVLVQLTADLGSPSGFRWSSRGPAITIESGTLCEAKIIIKTQPPIRLVIPSVKKALGLH